MTTNGSLSSNPNPTPDIAGIQVINAAHGISFPFMRDFGPNAVDLRDRHVTSVTIMVRNVGDTTANTGRGSVTIDPDDGAPGALQGLRTGETYTWGANSDAPLHGDGAAAGGPVDFLFQAQNAADDVTILVTRRVQI